MGLSQNIMVKSQFNIKGPDGSGSLGNSPHKYVVRYAARGEATEDLAPVRKGLADAYIARYMAREDATESAVEEIAGVPRLKASYRRAQGLGGRTFGPEGPSLSHDEVLAKAENARLAFESGRPIIMPIISFTEEYLKENGIVDEDFHCEKRGDYRGHIDQMRLRMAIGNGMKNLTRSFDDPDWIGAIQVDTEHVHCHLALWDRGEGRLLPNGQQRGKITAGEIKRLRHGIDMELDTTQSLRLFSANISDDRRNVKCFVKRYAHDVMLEAGEPQFLLACLPDDKRLWRISTNRKEMRKANAVVREFVRDVLALPDSGWNQVRREIARYSLARARREDLDMDQVRTLTANGEQRIIDECCNGVYDVLRQVPDEERPVRTPLLDIMGMEYADMAALQSDDPIVEFGFRLRSYSSRLDYHRRQRRRFKDLLRVFDESDVEEDSPAQAMRAFYESEMFYNEMVMAKYQHFLAFLPDAPEVDERLADLEDYGRRRDRLSEMIEDTSFAKFSPEGAEIYGRETYGQRGGHFLQAGMTSVLEERLGRMETNYWERVNAFNDELVEHAMQVYSDFEETPEGKQRLRLRMRRHIDYAFDEVKALDMHHMAYDFPYDAPVSRINVDNFVSMARERRDTLDAALDYLSGTDQRSFIRSMPVADIRAMNELADSFETRGVLVSSRPSASGRKKSHTTSLDSMLSPSIKAAVKATVASAQSFYESA